MEAISESSKVEENSLCPSPTDEWSQYDYYFQILTKRGHSLAINGQNEGMILRIPRIHKVKDRKGLEVTKFDKRRYDWRSERD